MAKYFELTEEIIVDISELSEDKPKKVKGMKQDGFFSEGDIVTISNSQHWGNNPMIVFYTSKRGNWVTTGLDFAGSFSLRGIGLHDGNKIKRATEKQKTDY